MGGVDPRAARSIDDASRLSRLLSKHITAESEKARDFISKVRAAGTQSPCPPVSKAWSSACIWIPCVESWPCSFWIASDASMPRGGE